MEPPVREHEKLIAGIDKFLADHEDTLRTIQERDPGFALLALAAKAYKTTHAVHLLAREGFGPDALILGRSLLNLAATLAYIAENDSEHRTRQWAAYTLKQRAKVNRELNEPEPEVTPEEDRLAREWKKLTIEELARRTGWPPAFYTAYRHSSSYEHSDAWAARDFGPLAAISIKAASEPDGTEVGSAPFVAAMAMICAVDAIGKYAGVGVGPFWSAAMDVMEGMVPDAPEDPGASRMLEPILQLTIGTATDQATLTARVRDYLSAATFADAARVSPGLAQKRARYNPESVWKALRAGGGFDQGKIVPYLLFPLDSRWLYYEMDDKLWQVLA